MPFPKGPCTHIVYTLALMYALYRYIGPKVYAIWVHGPSGNRHAFEIKDYIRQSVTWVACVIWFLGASYLDLLDPVPYPKFRA